MFPTHPPSGDNSQGPQLFSQPPPLTNPNAFYRPSPLHNIDTPNSEPESPIGLDGIQLDGSAENSSTKKIRVPFTVQEDIILVRSWVNTSKDPIIGVDQTLRQYWSRITEAYNNDEDRGEFPERESTQLKARWNRIHPAVQKFIGCYKQAISQKKSGSSEKDVMAFAHKIYTQDTGKKFDMEHAWVILRDEPKWQSDFVQHNSKRGKVTSAGGYSSSSNTETPIELDEYEIPTPTSRPIGQKAAKRKAKGKETSNTNVVDFSGIENAIKEKNAYASRLIELKEAQERRLAYETIMKDTSNMNETQREAHEKYCNYLKQQYGF
ncbi:glutathione S-transferase T3 [Cajanus cajan]|uniref:glutathione S-transferase T3 n=1 Tax=Cajanus cajan TaxID=3821 RepID=UPI00098DC54E|nr:glutathione S-transferase T3 [Cajanus cajan]